MRSSSRLTNPLPAGDFPFPFQWDMDSFPGGYSLEPFKKHRWLPFEKQHILKRINGWKDEIPLWKDPFLGGHDNFLGSTSIWPSPLTASAPTAPTLPCCASSRSFCEGTKTKTMCRWPLSSTGSLGASGGPHSLKGGGFCIWRVSGNVCFHIPQGLFASTLNQKLSKENMWFPSCWNQFRMFLCSITFMCFKWGSWGRLSVKHPHNLRRCWVCPVSWATSGYINTNSRIMRMGLS